MRLKHEALRAALAELRWATVGWRTDFAPVVTAPHHLDAHLDLSRC